ncbi:beta-xylosidase [Amycolatopsis sp. K13G38]|uniref:Beta-xylosidase n=1 Tax=Amycolatopsis acididurans TaxID=2724524 RepID=A0ABX1J1N4_9PSEU|nr:beta-xylosidase [Amycolatopsis acididurans]NKQ53688.1 beta-xylosidase [Amycolatopsis acididurans]
MRGFHRRLGAVLLAATLSAAGLAGCTNGTSQTRAEGTADVSLGGTKAPAIPADVTLHTSGSRESGVVAAGGPGAPYNYGPTVMLDGGGARMWWCSQYPTAPPPGDDILYGEAPTPDGPFTGPGGAVPPAVLSGDPGQFDGAHTCDPSVIRVNGIYYMYYTGAAGDHALGNAIGLATRIDGITWTRANGPIVSPSHDVHRDNLYGAGQPSAVYRDGWFYLMFTDTTGRAAGWNGAGQFLLRARDPAFTANVEALGDNGFQAAPNSARTRSVVDAFSADLMWVDALDAFAIAHETQDGTTITFAGADFTASPYRPVVIPGAWQEGPGLLRQPDGHAPVSATDPCGTVPLDVVRATTIGQAGAPTDLRRFGIDVTGVNGCADTAHALTVLDGFAMPSPARTMDLVVAGHIVRVDRRSVAEQLARHVLDSRMEILDRVPVAARLVAGARAITAPGLGLGLLLDDGKLWPAHPDSVAEVNGSRIETVTPAEWRSYPEGAGLGR